MWAWIYVQVQLYLQVHWVLLTSLHRSRALKVKGLHRPCVMEVCTFVTVSQVFAKSLHSVSGARDVAVPVAGLDWDQDRFHHVPAWG